MDRLFLTNIHFSAAPFYISSYKDEMTYHDGFIYWFNSKVLVVMGFVFIYRTNNINRFRNKPEQ